MFRDDFHCSREKTRTSGTFAAQNFRQTKCSVSSPTRRDVNSYSRGSTGKRESRSRDIDTLTNEYSGSSKVFVGLCILIRSL